MTSVNEVVTLVFATSGAGKTTWIKEQSGSIIRKQTGLTSRQFNTKYGFPAIIDGDELIAETIGWPSGAWWDELPESEYNQFIENVMQQIGATARRSFVVFGVFPSNNNHINTLLQYIDPSNVEILMVPSWNLERNMASRKAKLPSGSVKPTDANRSIETQEHAAETWSKFTNRSVVRQWDSLPVLFTEYLQLFTNGVKSIKHIMDEQSNDNFIVDGVIKGGLVRVRFNSGQPELLISYADSEQPFEVDGEFTEIYPSQSSLWENWSSRFKRARHALGSRLR